MKYAAKGQGEVIDLDPGGVRTLVDIGEDIHQWCLMNHIKKSELAEALDVDEKTVYNLWYGKHAPSGPMRRALSILMDKPLDFFIESCEPEVEDRIKKLERKIRNQNGGRKVPYPSIMEEDKLDRRLDAAVSHIKAATNIELKEHMVMQCELASQAAKLFK